MQLSLWTFGQSKIGLDQCQDGTVICWVDSSFVTSQTYPEVYLTTWVTVNKSQKSWQSSGKIKKRYRDVNCNFMYYISCIPHNSIYFRCSHVLHLRNFVKTHPTHTLIELNLYDTNQSAEIMSSIFKGISPGLNTKQCWGHSNIRNHPTGIGKKRRKKMKINGK